MKSIKHYISTIIHHPTKVIWEIDTVFLGGRLKRVGKKGIKFVDRKIFSGRILRKIQKRRLEKSYPQYAIISVKDYILAQYNNGRFSDFHMVDLAHRLFAIEQYYGKNTFGYELYRKMQEISGGNTYENWLKRFQKLIQEYDKSKIFNEQYPLVSFVNNWNLKDGAHRLALAYYHGEEFVPVKIEYEWRDRRWNYNWLWSGEYGSEKFSAKEIKLITDRTKCILEDCNYDYIGAIWPPAMHCRGEIIKDINLYGQYSAELNLPMGTCKVIDYRDIEFDQADFLGFMRMMYKEDIITEQNLIRKYNLILSAMPQNTEKLSVRVFSVRIEHPCIERREENNSAQSKAVVDLKQAIRQRYKDQIPNYQYDICFHLSDNYQQSKFCKIGLEMSRDISGLFEEMNKRWDYVICKTEKRIAPDFPYYYYYYSDADIVMDSEKMLECADYIEKWLKEKYKESWFHVDRVKSSNNIGVILKLRGFRMIYFDLQTAEHFGFSSGFTKNCLLMRIKSDNEKYFVCPPNVDILIRATEFIREPNKVWHREYIKENIKEYNENLLTVAFEDESCELAWKVRQLIKDLGNEK